VLPPDEMNTASVEPASARCAMSAAVQASTTKTEERNPRKAMTSFP
jgi:hypothetical protein